MYVCLCESDAHNYSLISTQFLRLPLLISDYCAFRISITRSPFRELMSSKYVYIYNFVYHFFSPPNSSIRSFDSLSC